MRLFHFSDDPNINQFSPRPVQVPSPRPAGLEWLNGPLVWAVEEAFSFHYMFPRQCSRILLSAKAGTTIEDRTMWLGTSRGVAYIEQQSLTALSDGQIHRYELPPDGFFSLDDAGMWVSRLPQTPLHLKTIFNLPAALAESDVELRVVANLAPLRPLWQTSLHVSGIRLRNAITWTPKIS